MGKRMRRIVNILTCKESTAAKGDGKHTKRDGSVRKRAVAQLIEEAVDTGHAQQNGEIETSRSAEDIYHDIKVSIDSLREKIENHDKQLRDAILSHCIACNQVETNAVYASSEEESEEIDENDSSELDGYESETQTVTENTIEAQTSDVDDTEGSEVTNEIITSQKDEEEVTDEMVILQEECGKLALTETEDLGTSVDEMYDSGDTFKPQPLKEMSKSILISMVYENLLADKLAKQHTDPTQCNLEALAEHTLRSLDTSACSKSDDWFVFGSDAKIIDVLSRNNNHPGVDDDSEPDPEIQVKINFHDRPHSQSSKYANSVHRSSKAYQDYYLFPIGSFSTTSPITKWKDVTSIIPAGVRHKNVDDKKFGIFEKPKSTISQGLPTSSYLKAKSYAVRKLRPPLVCMEMLLEQNAKTRIFQETHAKFVCINLMMALRFLHEHGIAHGSVCPRKIILNDKGYPCLTGFETAEVVEDRPSRPRGKIDVEYSSPEQIYQECISESTDVYSLGVLTYHMIYGKPPHRGRTPVDTRRNALNKEFEARFSPEPISPEGRRLISRCIRKSEDRRFNIVDKKYGLFESVSWFATLNEDKLYKQIVSSPLLPLMSQPAPQTE